MVELKTLKETHDEVWGKLKIAINPLEKEFLRGRLIQISADKEEATKWIKAKKEAMKKYDGCDYLSQSWCSQENLKGDICFIKDFFNITEEDLK